MRRYTLTAILIWSVAALGGCGPSVKDYPYFVNQLADLDRLPTLESGIQCKQFSSYDRKSRVDEATGKYVAWEANGDCGQYIRKDPQSGEGVMAEIEGPGCIWRIWSANPQGKIRFYFDGASTPSYEFDFNELFTGKLAGFPRPLVWQRRVVLGGDNPASDCYVPIPFAKSCKVTADKPHNQYYHIGYTTYPKDWKVKTFSLPRTAEEEAAVERVCKALSNCGSDPQPVAGMKTLDRTLTLGPGDKTTHEITGAATIRQLFAKVDTQERWGRRKVLLQIYWDGETTPAVDAPIGDFFGDAWDEAEYKSLPLGITNHLNYSYWRMPFARSARIVITNQGGKPAELRYRIAYQPGAVGADVARFHAKWRRDRESSAFDYPMLECTGRGRFVGVVLFPDNIVGGWWGEGDEKVWVDGEKFPSTFGTGSEDYFGDAWGIRFFANPYHGSPTAKAFDATRRQSCYRWHIADNIPFANSFKIAIENYSALGKGPLRNDYSSMAYWYQASGGKDFFESVPVEGRIPQGPVAAGAIEAETCVRADALPAGAAIVSDEDLPEQLSQGKGLKITGEPGTKAALVLPVPEAGKYTIEAVTAKGARTAKFELLKDSRPATEYVRLAKGDNALEVRMAGEGGEVILDYFILHPYRNLVRNWYLIGPFDNTKGQGFDRADGPETEPFNAKKAYAGKGGEVRWKKISVPQGIVDSGQGYFKENNDITLYAYCEIVSPGAFKTRGYVGSDDGVKVWINGKLVHAVSKQRGLMPDEDHFDVTLDPGRNTVLLKVTQFGGPWGFAFRVNDPEGELSYSLSE
jgi:hypothetical protein